MLGYSRASAGRLLKELGEKGIKGVIIGSTVYQILLGWREFEDDVDIFATTFSPSFDEDLLLQATHSLNCFVGQNDWGMPQLKCPVGDEELTLEFFENLYDFYIPQEIISSARRIRLGDYEGEVIQLEDYLILKAKAGREKDLEDLWFLSDLLKDRKLRIDKRLMRRHIELFEHEDTRLINKRLRQVGLLK